MKARCVRSLEEAAAGSRRRQPADEGLLIKQPRRGDRAIGLLVGSRVGVELDYCLNAELQGRSPVATSWLRAGRPRFPWAVAQGYLLSPLRGLESFVTEALMQCRSSLNRLSHCAVREHFASSTCCNFALFVPNNIGRQSVVNSLDWYLKTPHRQAIPPPTSSEPPRGIHDRLTSAARS